VNAPGFLLSCRGTGRNTTETAQCIMSGLGPVHLGLDLQVRPVPKTHVDSLFPSLLFPVPAPALPAKLLIARTFSNTLHIRPPPPLQGFTVDCTWTAELRQARVRGEGLAHRGFDILSRRATDPTRALPHVLAQHSIDACLISLIGARVALEPSHDIGIEPQGQLLFDRPIEQAAPGPGPVKKLRRV
jgi:hypothetical protein